MPIVVVALGAVPVTFGTASDGVTTKEMSLSQRIGIVVASIFVSLMVMSSG
jgi:hypothetical protein